VLEATLETEIAGLAARYGAPRRVAVQLEGRPFDPIDSDDRYGEVCMVVRRPDGRLVTAIKTFYPPGAFRLLTGGIGPGEPVEAALLREVAEETGLHVAIAQFLAVIEYRLHPAARVFPGRAADFVTFAFLLDERGGTLAMHDPGEHHGDFGAVEIDQLADLAATLAASPDFEDRRIRGSWRDWGRFRSVVHTVVWDALRAVPAPRPARSAGAPADTRPT
jgi:8-oxo-dGTP pyrophosphatase MutT (NUDIX family)